MTFDPMGTTVLITGASSGLGTEFAHRFAERGADLVLVARREQRMRALAAELATKFGTHSEVIVSDLAEPGAVGRLVEELEARGIRISSLVNNAGSGTHGLVVDSDPARLEREVALNVQSLLGLSLALLPRLREAAIERPDAAALVNVASTAAFQPIPRMAVYGATKAFVLSFTEALAWEERANDLRVLALNPGPAATEFFTAAGSDDMVFGRPQTPGQVVATAFRALDRRRTPASIISGTQNFVQTVALRLAPRALVLQIVGRGGESRH